MAYATLRYHSQLGYGFYVKLTPIITAKPLHIPSITRIMWRRFMKRLYKVVYLKDTRSYTKVVVKLLIPKVPVKPVTSMMASVVALNPAVALLIATKLRVPKVN